MHKVNSVRHRQVNGEWRSVEIGRGWPGERWDPNEMFILINNALNYLWRAVDHHAEKFARADATTRAPGAAIQVGRAGAAVPLAARNPLRSLPSAAHSQTEPHRESEA
jgi:hypothetical protein